MDKNNIYIYIFFKYRLAQEASTHPYTILLHHLKKYEHQNPQFVDVFIIYRH
jgi:hypothetical protein